jgi:hypothetical protein
MNKSTLSHANREQDHSAVEINWLLACIYMQGTGLNSLHQIADAMSYRLEPVYAGDIPCIRRKGRWYSPLFWMKHVASLLMGITLGPLAFAAVAVSNAIRELRGGCCRAKESWEKEFVEANATPPIDYRI